MADHSDDLNFPAFNNNGKSGYTGTCHGCGDQVPLGELIKVRKSIYETHYFWLCECCHLAYWHGGFTEKQMYADLEIHLGLRDGKALPDEVKDTKRKALKKIELEEIADIVYELHFKKDKDIWKELEDSNK